MYFKNFFIAVLAGMSTLACASTLLPKNNGEAMPSANASCEVKPDRKMASCGDSSKEDETEKVTRRPYHHIGNLNR